MRSFDRLHAILKNTIDKYGSEGTIKHTRTKESKYDDNGMPIVDTLFYDKDGNEVDITSRIFFDVGGNQLDQTGIEFNIDNSLSIYDEEGNEFILTRYYTDTKVKYVSTRLKEFEKVANSLDDEMKRFTVSTPKAVRKQDIFVTADNIEYSIEKVDKVGETGNGVLILELLGRRV